MRRRRFRLTGFLFTSVIIGLAIGFVVEALALVRLSRRLGEVATEVSQLKLARSEHSTTRTSVAKRLADNDVTYDTFTVDDRSADIAFFFRNSANQRLETISTLRQYVKGLRRDLVFATNAGMFTPSREPLGLYIEDGRQLYPLNLSTGTGNFFLKPNGVFLLSDRGAFIVESTRVPVISKFLKISYATQSGPLLVINNKIHPAFLPDSGSKNIRSGVGILNSNRVIFAISNEAVTFYDFAVFFKDKLHCQDALYLDGMISQMYLPALNRRDLGGDFGAMIAITQQR